MTTDSKTTITENKTQNKDQSEYNIRLLCKSDYDKHFIELLSQLTTVGNVSRESFDTAFSKIPNDNCYVFVMEDTKNLRIIGTAKLLIEQKFTHNCKCVAHIEDVVVHNKYRKQGLGKCMINYCSNVAKEQRNCYKIILDCKESNAGFYEQCGFKRKDIQMAQYFE